jgi:hypothetical protein
MKKMSEFLAKVPRFALEAEETLDEIYLPKAGVAIDLAGRSSADRSRDDLLHSVDTLPKA